MSCSLPTFLPGRLSLRPGSVRDYTALAQFHYIAKRPATWARVWAIDYQSNDCSEPRVVAVGVLSYPVPACGARDRWLRLEALSRSQKLALANQQIRTISRVIVHPQFRSLGLSCALVSCLCENCDTRYIEAIAKMAHAHPFFERAGMTRIDPIQPDGAVYYILDRAATSERLAA